MSIPLFQVDAFTNKPFGGNPAAVCLLEEATDANWMQAVAEEMNLSETAFVRRVNEGYELRWFTPACEVDLCGHATLASAHALWTEGGVSTSEPIRFYTRSGVLTATKNGDLIELDFPATPPAACEAPQGLLAALRVVPTFVGRTQFDSFLLVESEEAVRSMQPDYRELAEIPTRGVIVTGRSNDTSFDFVSRFFAPAAGIDEDPVTGSAHCALAPFWAERLGKAKMIGFQASARGGVVCVRIDGDRVILGGQAVTALTGTLV